MDLEILNWFQGLFKGAYDFFDYFWLIISFFGTELFIICLVAIIYWVVDKKYGAFLAIVGLSSATINGGLKDIVKRPRPFVDHQVHTTDKSIGGIITADWANSYSFPSGHAQNSSTIFTSLILFIKKRWIIIVSIIMTILVCLSRIYLGVHYPSDVLVGLIIGIGLALLLHFLFNKFYQKRFYIYIGLVVIALLSLFFSTSYDTFTGIGSLLGAAVGLTFEQKFVKFEIKGSKLNKCIKVVVGLIILLALKEGLKVVFSLFTENNEALNNYLSLLRYFIVVFIGLAIYPWCFKKVEEKLVKKP